MLNLHGQCSVPSANSLQAAAIRDGDLLKVWFASHTSTGIEFRLFTPSSIRGIIHFRRNRNYNTRGTSALCNLEAKPDQQACSRTQLAGVKLSSSSAASCAKTRHEFFNLLSSWLSSSSAASPFFFCLRGTVFCFRRWQGQRCSDIYAAPAFCSLRDKLDWQKYFKV